MYADNPARILTRQEWEDLVAKYNTLHLEVCGGLLMPGLIFEGTWFQAIEFGCTKCETRLYVEMPRQRNVQQLYAVAFSAEGDDAKKYSKLME